MNSGKRKPLLSEAGHKEAGDKLIQSQPSKDFSGIDPDVLVEFGINPGDAANIRSRNDLIRAIAYKMLEKQGEPVDVDILASIELMVETDPILRDFIDRSFDS